MGVQGTSMAIAELAADLICVPVASVVSDGVAPCTSALSIVGGPAYGPIFVLAPAGVGNTSMTCDWLVLLLVLLSPRYIGGRDAAVFEVLAEAYSTRIGATLWLSGLEAFRFGRSWLLVIDNLPICTFFLTGWVKPSSLPPVLVEGFLVGILVN
jgi:hypothetical protein